MTRELPLAKDETIYTIDETAKLLKICRDTLKKYTDLGYFRPLEHLTQKRYYLGREIKRFWLDRF